MKGAVAIAADAKLRAAELRTLISAHNDAYYIRDDPSIGDDEYDRLLGELRALEEQHPELVAADSPTQRVGGLPLAALKKVEHLQPMLSLANVHSGEDLHAWVERMRTHLAREGIEQPEFSYICEPKIDGLAISLIYRDGLFERGVTRGNGEIGEDVTHNLRTIDQIPLRIRGDDVPSLLEVRGEIYLPLPAFQLLNERRAEAGESTFMNPRNAAAGAIRQLDPAVAAQRPLAVWCYAVGVTDGLDLHSHRQGLDWLSAHSFPVNKDIVSEISEDAVIARCERWLQRRGTLDFEIDGVVIKVDDRELQRRLGASGRDPRWAVAWKFPPTTAKTTLRQVLWNVGKSGDLRPYAELDKVQVGGVMVEHATLHNEEDIARKDLRPGDEVIVLRAGDVIPQVISPAPHAADRQGRSGPVIVPALCPSCGTATIKPEGAVFTKCPNRSCSGRMAQLLEHFVGKDAMDIEGLGEEQLRQLQRHGAIRDAADIYLLTAEQIVEVRLTEPFITVLVNSIENFGRVSAERLLLRFGNFKALLAATVDEVEAALSVAAAVDTPSKLKQRQARAKKLASKIAVPDLRERIDSEQGKIAQKLLDAIERSKQQPLERVLFALGLEGVGAETARILAQRFGSIDALSAATAEQIQELSGIGPIGAELIVAQLADRETKKLIERLRAAGLCFQQQATQTIGDTLAGLTFVLTGKLPTLTRAQATDMITAAGGKVASAVTAKTNYLVAGEAGGSKLVKAERLEVTVLSEQELLDLIGE